MHVSTLHKEFDALQLIHGDKALVSIYGGGEINSPDILFMFMNPTGRNIAADRGWHGLRTPWLGTKSVWKVFVELGLFDTELFQTIRGMSPRDWDESFSQSVYEEAKSNGLYITNLAKCTQIDARPLPNSVFKEYLELMDREVDILNPKLIVTFGNQVSSVYLDEKISVGKDRGVIREKVINGKSYRVLPTYYPVGQGTRNMPLAIEDIQAFID